jgi:hypothetical protein
MAGFFMRGRMGGMSIVIRFMGYVAAGATFWIPSILIHAVRGTAFGNSGLDILAVSVLPVIASLVTLEIIYRKQRTVSRRGTIALWMLLGIWLFGPLATTIGFTFGGAGLTQPTAWQMLLLGIPIFLPMTYMMSTYDGTLLALVVITIWFIAAGLGVRYRPSTMK